MFKSRCQACGKEYEFHEDKEDKQLECVQCGQVFTAARMGEGQKPDSTSGTTPTAPPPPGAPASSVERQGAGPRAKLVFVLGLVMVLGFIGYTSFVVMAGGGLPEWSRAFVSKGAGAVVYMDLEKVRGSDIFKKIKEAMGEQGDSLYIIYQMGLLGGGESGVTGEDVKSMIMSGDLMTGNFNDAIIGLQMKSDCSAADLAAGMETTAKKHKDTEYIEAVSGQSSIYLCRLDTAVFCVSRNENLLRGTIDRHAGGEYEELGDDMASALDSVDSRDIFAVMSMKAMSGAAGMPVPGGGFKCMGVGVNVNGSLDAKMVIAFEDRGTAQQVADGMEQALEMIEDAPPPAGADEAQKQLMELAKEMMSSMDVSRNGAEVTVTYGLKTDTIAKLLDHPQFRQHIGGMMSGIPSMGPGMPMQPQR